MRNPFDPATRLVYVHTILRGPRGTTALRLALDTGATVTTIRTASLLLIGYDLGTDLRRVPLTTGSGVEFVQSVRIDRLEALGDYRESFPVLAHTLPPSAGVDGLLGLDFFRDRKLTLDFRAGSITLE